MTEFERMVTIEAQRLGVASEALYRRIDIILRCNHLCCRSYQEIHKRRLAALEQAVGELSGRDNVQ